MHMQDSPRKGMFVTADGQNVLFTFILVTSLFLLWGFCNGMIDVMDKHFQDELHLSLSQSAWVQFAHYLGYFLMSLPAGWLAIKLGYRGGIIAGLLVVAVGGAWFLPATHIAQFWAFLLGVCIIASGLTFLETVANPYTTVLGDPRFSATRINLAQSCNGIGWILGPIAGREFFYSVDRTGHSTGSQTLWIPYVAVAGVVIVLSLIFSRANVPDIKNEDDYHLDDTAADVPAERIDPIPNRGVALFLIWLNIVILGSAIGMICSAIASVFLSDGAQILEYSCIAGAVVVVIGTILLATRARHITHHNIWSHPHFSSATIAQFFYVAAQAGIFAFFVNYMTSEAPIKINNADASTLASVAFGCFLSGRVIGSVLLKKFRAHTVLGVFGLCNIVVCILIVSKLGWISMISVFLSYFFMSVMFPTIFALGIHGLGVRAKKASGYIVMAIMGGAIVPKLMGHIADKTDISHGFLVPMCCFAALAALYSFLWPSLAGSDGMQISGLARGIGLRAPPASLAGSQRCASLLRTPLCSPMADGMSRGIHAAR